MTTIKLGHEVRDGVSGIIGITIYQTELLTGSVQMAVQPKVRAGETDKMPDAYSVDVQMLEYVGEGVADRVTPPDDVRIPLGVEVKDKVSGANGTTVEKVTYLNGCVRYIVQPKYRPGKALIDEMPQSFGVDYKRLVPVKGQDGSGSLSKESFVIEPKKATGVAQAILGNVRARADALFGPVREPTTGDEAPVAAAPAASPGKGGPSRRVENSRVESRR